MNEAVCSIWFNVVEGEFKYKAGQFVNLKFTDANGEEVQRAYSVASAPAGESGLRFELCIEIVEGGRAGKYFSEMKVGDECKFKGPFGFCTLPPESKEAVLVGTGTGIAPIKAILEDLKNKRMETKVSVLFGFRHWENRFYLEELDRLSSEIQGDFWICMSRQNMGEVVGLDKYKNLKFVEGRVTSLLQESEILDKDQDLYICGGSNMIKEVREMGLHAGVDKSRIYVEIFD
jgi:ferredoxin-NADP reductase